MLAAKVAAVAAYGVAPQNGEALALSDTRAPPKSLAQPTYTCVQHVEHQKQPKSKLNFLQLDGVITIVWAASTSRARSVPTYGVTYNQNCSGSSAASKFG